MNALKEADFVPFILCFLCFLTFFTQQHHCNLLCDYSSLIPKSVSSHSCRDNDFHISWRLISTWHSPYFAKILLQKTDEFSLKVNKEWRSNYKNFLQISEVVWIHTSDNRSPFFISWFDLLLLCIVVQLVLICLLNCGVSLHFDRSNLKRAFSWRNINISPDDRKIQFRITKGTLWKRKEKHRITQQICRSMGPYPRVWHFRNI